MTLLPGKELSRYLHQLEQRLGPQRYAGPRRRRRCKEIGRLVRTGPRRVCGSEHRAGARAPEVKLVVDWTPWYVMYRRSCCMRLRSAYISPFPDLENCKRVNGVRMRFGSDGYVLRHRSTICVLK